MGLSALEACGSWHVEHPFICTLPVGVSIREWPLASPKESLEPLTILAVEVPSVLWHVRQTADGLRSETTPSPGVSAGLEA
jgi:hypothetical protein